MASQNPSERSPYPPQGYAPPPTSTPSAAVQNLNIAGAPSQTWPAAGARPPFAGSFPVQNPLNRPSGPSPFNPNAAPPMVRPTNLPPTTILPLTASANGPPQMIPPGVSSAASVLPYQQGINAGRPPIQSAGAPVPSWQQNNAPANGPPAYTGRGPTPMPPIGSIRPPTQASVMGAPPMYSSSTANTQVPWRAPQPQTAAGMYPGAGLPTRPGTGTSPGAPPTWPAAQPAYPGVPPVMRPQTIPGMPVQGGAPVQHPPMSQYLAQGLSQPGSPAATSAGGSSRIDPTQIPRPQTSSAVSTFETRINNQAAQPPSATSTFIVRDMGNCSPRYMRCTLNQIPCSGDLLANSGMPLALMVQPLALPHPMEEPIHVVDFGENGPVRCIRCKAYINPFMRFIDQGRRFKCNFCGQTNDTPRDYHCNLGPDNRRRDVDSRPELSRGTVEFVATKDFLVRPPMLPMFFFLIDVSMKAVETGATAAACSAVHRALGELFNVPHAKVGIATFDNTLHFYNFNQGQQPSMLVVPDVQDVYAPLQSGLTVPVIEYREQLEQLLENIPSMFQGTTIADSALGAAIKGASLAIKSNGGKLLVFQSGFPSTGFAALTARDSDSRKGPPGEKDLNKLLQPIDKTLKTLAVELAELQVCCDLFLTTQEYVDVASLAVVPGTTGGQIYYYHPFSATSDSAKLYNDLRWNLTRPQGMEAVMRVRCSQGLQVQEYVGNFHRGTLTDVDLPAIDCDKSLMVTFKHDEKLQDNSDFCFQCALLYTTIDGQRRIRVTTLSLTCTTVLNNVFRGADLDAQFTYFLKHAAQEAPATSLAQLREKMTNSCVNILFTYRKFCATASSAGQLILPEALKLLPLYTLALTKSIGLRSDARTDDRCYWLARVLTIASSLAIPTVYPRMFSIHDLSRKEISDGNLPPPLHLSSENLESEGVFLLETGEDAFIYAGKGVSSETLFQLFGVQSVNEMQTNQFVLQEFDNDASRKLNALVNEIRKERCSYLRFHWCRRGDPLEFLFFSLLVEDKNALGLSYVEYLVHVHRQIQNKMT
ncbi:hypothetical protein GOP47_0017637 [Adiantum capillus-veneris]|uniref:Uncharacterized protein n=1 Tax=Adiantum capillus-veneris TaxID=13818 RepID=A0A9D4UGR2_ADICA|nr:hypothetical protein GOP47_0017637 [Adiantum capillus-veneris]